MGWILTVFVTAASALLQFAAGAVLLTYLRLSRRKAAWLLVSAAFFLMGGRRLLVLFDLAERGRDAALSLSELAGLAIAILMFAGVALIGNYFRAVNESEKRARRLNDVLRAVRDVNQLIAHERDTRTLLEKACGILVGTRGYRMVWAGLVEEGHKRVVPSAAAGEGADYFDEVTVTWDEGETGTGPSGTAIRTRRPDVCRNMAEDPRFAPWRQAALKRGFASSAAAPMIYCERVFGVLNVCADRPDAFDEEEVGLLAEVASDLGFALQSIEDEAKRRQAEQDLRESEERFRSLSEATFEGIAVHEKGVILEANEAFARMFGYERGEVIGMNALDFAAPESRDLVRQNILLGSEKPYEAFGFRKDGTKFPGELHGRAFPFRGRTVRVTALRDITDRKRADEALRRSKDELEKLVRERTAEVERAYRALKESEERYRLLAENATDVIWMMDLELRLTYISPSVERLRGFSVEEVMKQTLAEALTPASLEYAMRVFAEEMAREEQMPGRTFVSRTLELEQLRRDGSAVWVEATATFVRDAGGRPVQILGVTRDISERKRLEEQVLQSEKMAAVGTLIAGLSHELNNPLGVILGYAQSLLKHAEPGSPLRPALQSIEKEAQRCASLVKALLGFSRKQPSPRAPVSPATIVRRVAEMAKGEILGRGIAFHVETPPGGLASLSVCLPELESALLNVIANARDATGPGGSIRLDAVPSVREGVPGVEFRVTDTGCGIPPEQINRIFEPFFTTKPVGKGTGLGLSIARQITESHGGRITAQSMPGAGTTMTLWLPATREAEAPGPDPAA
jgi:PAS domain S-box-containing protein